MGQARPFRATALIVEDDSMQRAMLSLLLEESGYRVIACERAEDAQAVLEQTTTPGLCLLMTDVQLAGVMTGVELAHVAKARNPQLDVVVTSGRPLTQPLPDGAKFWAKPWAPLDVLREAELAQLS
ncbi:hypothetical protein C2U70_20560 [Bradyrhizobium guangdongense]|uniref:response regulator n=1 Tax=Bradyrhizobium guangdongense TaxID=1325090 RepID=UPI00112E1BEC|nr:response regulator [Bradyrhizobium guangdongense]TPQ32845.1 hypothetical protein C2U70_20560 [Bradyrhizobium guangdongense]